jgi:hypothetical protein
MVDCLKELKEHLADYVSCSDAVLKGTTLHWKFLDGEMIGVLIMLHDTKSVILWQWGY